MQRMREKIHTAWTEQYYAFNLFRLEDRLEDSGFLRKSTSLYVAEIQKVAGILGDMGDFLRN